jgi:hypothetical protein
MYRVVFSVELELGAHATVRMRHTLGIFIQGMVSANNSSPR